MIRRRLPFALRACALLAALALVGHPTARAQTLFASSFEPGEGGVCAGFYDGGFTPVLGPDPVTAPTLPRPAKGVANTDPNFGTCVVRATDHAVEPPSGFARNDYSRRQAFNADNSRFLAYALNGAWHLYDAQSLAHLRVLNGPAGDAEPQWHPSDPKLLYWIPLNGGMQLNRLDVESNSNTVASSFAGKLPWPDVARVWTKSEGSPSADGRYWCFMAETDAFQIRGAFTYDLQTGTVLGTRAISNRPDHVSMSASGRWCVISGGDVSDGTVAWSRDFSASLPLHTTSEHSDLALGLDGHDLFVFVDYQSNSGDLMMVDLDSGQRSALFATYISGTATAYHVSGKNFARPGWVLLSTYAHSGAEQWLHERILAVELKANPTLVNLAHHHSYYNGYWTEPHASVNRDFTRVLFSSNWASQSDTDVDAYLIVLPPNLLP
ncbi:MAG: TolB family protein [Lysobacterales bacterium]